MEVMPATMEFILLLLRMLPGMDTPLTSSTVLELILVVPSFVFGFFMVKH